MQFSVLKACLCGP